MTNTWLIIGLTAQGLIALCFLGQFVAFFRTGKVVVPSSAIGLGLVGAIVALVYAVVILDIALIIADATILLAGWQMLVWHRRSGGKPAADRRPGLPVVAPHAAEPRSGIVPVPKPGDGANPR